MTTGNGSHVAIVGAGIVGVATAVWMQRAGHRVTLIDRSGPAAGASFGNAGVLAASSVVPIVYPGILPKLPGLILGRNSPVFLRWRRLPQLLPFLLRLLGHGNRRDVDRISRSLKLLLQDSFEQHQALVRGTGAEQYLKAGDYVYAYSDRTAYESDAFAWGVRRERGYEFEEMDASRLAEYDPALSGRFGFAVRCPGHGFLTDPGAYVAALAEHVAENGGRLLITDVLKVTRDGAIETVDGLVHADKVVVACGVQSAKLVRDSGARIPLESERGYHVEYRNPSLTFRSPVMVAASKFVMCPMRNRLRCAGLAEFGSVDDGPSKAPVALIERHMEKLFPELTHDGKTAWMGHRPSTSDALPVIGKLGERGNVWVGFGHQHVGITGGPRTGRWLARLASGNQPNEDLSAFSPTRFE